MITKKQLEIFQVFAKNPFGEFTMSQIKEISGNNSNNLIEKAVKKFREEGLFFEKKIGRSVLYSLDLRGRAPSYIALANSERLDYLAGKAVRMIREDVLRGKEFSSVVIFGSYAIGKESRKSDLDIVVLTADEKAKRKIEIALNGSELNSPTVMDWHVFSRKEFVEMLINDEENLGKQIARKHMAVHNSRIFYDVVREGMRRGFRI